MVAIEHRQKSSATIAAVTTTATASTAAELNVAVLSPTSSASSSVLSSTTSSATTTTSSVHQQEQQSTTATTNNNKKHQKQASSTKAEKMSQAESGGGGGGGGGDGTSPDSEKHHRKDSSGAVSKSAVSQRNVDIKISKKSNVDAASKELTKKVLKLDLSGKELDEFSLKSPKSPITARLPHQTSLTSSVDVEDRKTLREALYQGIFHRHRRTIFAVGSFLRMLRSRNSQYNTIRSSSEGEDVDEVR